MTNDKATRQNPFWWAELSTLEKSRLFDKYIVNDGPHYRAWWSLTKEEIESIRLKENGTE